MENKNALIAEKERFSTQLVQAIIHRSSSELCLLVPSFEEYRSLLIRPRKVSKKELASANKDDIHIYPKAYLEHHQQQAVQFFKKYHALLEKHIDSLNAFVPNQAKIQGVNSSAMLPEVEVEYISTTSMAINLPPFQEDHTSKQWLQIKIERPYFLSGKLCLPAASEIRCHIVEYREPTVDPQLAKLGAALLSKPDYFSIMRAHRWHLTEKTADYLWHRIPTSLSISSQITQQFSPHAVLIDGDLRVEGLCDLDDIACVFVLGDLYADSLLAGSSTLFVAGTVYVNQLVCIQGGSGAPIQIQAIQAPFLYTDSDAFTVYDTCLQTTHCVIDYSDTSSKGDLSKVLKPQFIEQPADETEDLTPNVEKLVQAVTQGQKVLLEH